MSANRRLSIITPAFREARNLPMLYERLERALATTAFDWEWIIVDDHSPDDTFEVITRLAARDGRVRGLRLARNGGSHRAVLCGLEHSLGEVAAVIAGDLQDPPELIPELLARWQDGAQVVWGVRRAHPGQGAIERFTGRLFHRAMRRLTGIEHMPANGADCFAIDRVVIDALGQFGERHVSLFVLLTWLGYRQANVTYDKAPRGAGRSGWTWAKKLECLVDSVTAFSYAPVRAMTYVGALTALIGLLATLYVVILAVTGTPPVGWASLMVVVLFLGGLQMLMLGVLGEYLWRTLDEARRRPRALIETMTPDAVRSRDDDTRAPLVAVGRASQPGIARAAGR